MEKLKNVYGFSKLLFFLNCLSYRGYNSYLFVNSTNGIFFLFLNWLLVYLHCMLSNQVFRTLIILIVLHMILMGIQGRQLHPQ